MSRKGSTVRLKVVIPPTSVGVAASSRPVEGSRVENPAGENIQVDLGRKAFFALLVFATQVLYLFLQFVETLRLDGLVNF